MPWSQKRTIPAWEGAPKVTESNISQDRLQEITQGLFQPGFDVSKHENFSVSPGNLCEFLTTHHFPFYLIRIFHGLPCSWCPFVHWSTAVSREPALPPLHTPPGHCGGQYFPLYDQLEVFALERRISDCPLQKIHFWEAMPKIVLETNIISVFPVHYYA